MDSIPEQIMQAVGIMFLGMGLVFVFLTLLILCIRLVAIKFAPLSKKQETKTAIDESTQLGRVDPKIVAVITSAIYQYRVKA
ncbi:MAG: OadG family protein [Shewanella sp.]